MLEVAGWGVNFSQARKRAYEAAGKIHFKDSFYINNIDNKALKYFITKD